LTLLFVAGVQLYRGSQGLGAFVYGSNDLSHFFLNLGFIQQGIIRTEYSFNGPAWSLTVEELSYFLFFVSLFFFAAHRILAFSFLLLLGAIINVAGWDAHVFNLDVSRGLVGFFAGCLAYQLHRWRTRRAEAPSWRGRLRFCCSESYSTTCGRDTRARRRPCWSTHS